MKKAQLKTILLLIFIGLIGIVSVLGLTVTSNYPKSEWVTDNSVDFNFTPSGESTTIEWCAIRINGTVRANYTDVDNGTNHVLGISVVDSNDISGWYWNVTCYNGSDEVNSSLESFGVDGNTPSITLDSPDDEKYQMRTSAGFYFKYTPTDASNLNNCSLYTNYTGTWAINETNGSVNSGYQDVINFTYGSDVSFVWNVWCNDSANNDAWAEDTNRTLYYDGTAPTAIKITTPSNKTYSDNGTIYMAWNTTTESHFYRYVAYLSNDSNITHHMQTREVTNRTHNFTTFSNIENDGTYYLKVGAEDLAGNGVNSSVFYYYLNRVNISITLNNPSSNGTYESDSTPDFNFTLESRYPKDCNLYLSNSSGGGIRINKTVRSVTNGTVTNITPSTMIDGTYHFNIECNDSYGRTHNFSGSDYVITIDTTSPSQPNLTHNWALKNNTDRTPTLSWLNGSETNFDKYQVRAFYFDNGTEVYQTNVSTNTDSVALSLVEGYTYNFSVTAYDLAGNTATSGNTTDSLYYVDTVCGNLTVGWNLCGATWTTARNLSVIGNQTDATFVSVWNMSNHAWATCNYAVSAGGSNCNLNVSIGSYYQGLLAPSISSNITVNKTDGSNLSAGNYTYKISAVWGSQESIASSNITVHVDLLAGNISQLSWTASSGATSYRIYNATRTSGFGTYFTTTDTSFNHTGQAVTGTGTPKTSGTPYYIDNDVSPAVWIYVNESTLWRNRTWSATATSANITLTNHTNGWNIITGIFRNGIRFGDLGKNFGWVNNTQMDGNATMFSMPYERNTTTVPFVNIGNYHYLKNETLFDYGRAMWVYYNQSGMTNFDNTGW